MRIGFITGTDKSLELDLAKAFKRGSSRHGHSTDIMTSDRFRKSITDYDAFAFTGVKGMEIAKLCKDNGVPFFYFDKGYIRDRIWWRVSYCSHHPTQYLYHMDMPEDRFEKTGWGFRKWQSNKNGHILLAGSSLKYHIFYGLPHPSDYAENIITKIREHSRRPVLYRPKKTWKDAVPVKGSQFSTEKSIWSDLEGAFAFVTHGSNACFEAMLYGIPAVILGDAVTRPISSIQLERLWDGGPHKASNARRRKLLCNLAYCQYKVPEISEGRIWRTLDEFIRLRETIRQTP